MRTVIYARKSTESEERQIQSLEDQIRECEAIARRERLRVSEIYQEARSAKEPEARPEFQRLVADIRSGKVERVLTWSTTRLSRNPVDGGVIAYLLQTGRLQEIRTAERVYRPDDNAILLSIENGMATAYLQDLRRNVMRGMRGKAERGWHACKAPVGYRNDFETREILPDPERFSLVREAWDLLLRERLSVARIHRRLAAKGLSVRRRSGGASPISAARLYTVFRSEFYAGKVVFKGEVLPGKHEPMVSEDEFKAAQEILGAAGKAKAPESREMPFAGVFRCARCGCAIVGETKTKRYPRTGRTTTYRYYHCSGSKGCSKRSVREEELAERALKVVERIRMPAPIAVWLGDTLLDSLESGSVDTADGLAELERGKDEEEARIRRLNRMRLDGELSSSEYAEMKGDLLSSVEELQRGIHQRRDRAGRLMRHLAARLDAAVAAGELAENGDDPRILARVLKMAGGSVLNLFPFEFRLDPILEKIAAFEPLRSGSEKPERGDSVNEFPVWWSLVQELRTLASEELDCADERERTRSHQDRRWYRKHGVGRD